LSIRPLADNGVGDIGVESIVKALNENPNLIALQLSKFNTTLKATIKLEMQEQHYLQE
jgi:hypothetical protein